MIVYTARHVLPVASPPLRDAAVVVAEGRIAAVGPVGDVRAMVGSDAPERQLGDAVILPGLINAHTHLELSWLAGGARPVDYVAWLQSLLTRRETEEEPVAVEAARQALRFLETRGVVAIGDVANHPWCAPLLAESSLWGTVFLECYGLDADRDETRLEQIAATIQSLSERPELQRARDRVRVVPTPHAPHTTSPGLLRALAGRARASRSRYSVHLAESAAEVEWLERGAGPLRALYEARAFARGTWAPPGRSPVGYLDRLGVLGEHTLAVHCVRMDHADLSLLQSRRATVVTCPRSNQWLQVGQAPVPQLLAAGIPVALGTDSLASCPDLDLFAEMRALRSIHPSLHPPTVLRMATLNGARALGIESELGSLEAGKRAAAVVVELTGPHDDPWEAILDVPARVRPLLDAETAGIA